MVRTLPLLLLLLLPTPAPAADRTVGLGSFDRLRVEGPFRVRVATGSPRATVSGDRQAIDEVEVRGDGDTLVVRMGSNGWGERPVAGVAPIVVTLSTPALARAWVSGAAELTVARMKGQRVDLSVSGSGTVSVAAVDADQLSATVIGSGTVTLAGHVARAQLIVNGPGGIDAGALVADDLTLIHDGAGNTRAQARYTARVTHTGLGQVEVVGNARCSVKAAGGGPVSCGPKL